MRHLPKIAAITILSISFMLAKQPSLSPEEESTISKQFKFDRNLLYEPDKKPEYVRKVHPQYADISTWISSVGASIAFMDFDKDNLYNDIVHVDPRYNTVYLYPAPNSGKRFEPIELIPKTVEFDENTMKASGILTNDFNQDGREDVLVFYLGRSPVIFYNKDGKFTDENLVTDLTWNSTAGTLADFNGDGHTDVFIANYFPDNSKLYHSSATDSEQIMQHSMSRAHNGAKNRILIWKETKDGKAVFEESLTWDADFEHSTNWTLAVAAADINGDLLPDLYIANDFGPDKLLLNQTSNKNKISFKELKGRRGFTTVRSNVIGEDSFKGMGADFSDLNNDGNLDIYVSNIADDYALHESHFMFINSGNTEEMAEGVAPFKNESEPLGLSRSSWGWDSKITDFNNDGIKEAIQATGFVKGEIDRWPQLQELATTNDELLKSVHSWPHLKPGDDISGDSHIPLFVKGKSGKYFDVAGLVGLDEEQVTRGIAISDVDHDGRLDFASAGQWNDSKLYQNKAVTNNRFIGLQLCFSVEENVSEIIVDNDSINSRPAIGAVAKLNIKDRKMISYIDGGNGHAGSNSKEIHFGLANDISENEKVSVELFWKNSKGENQKTIVQLLSGWHKIILPF